MNKEPAVIGRPDFEHAVEASKLSSQVRLWSDDPTMTLFRYFVSRSIGKYFILDNIFNCKNKQGSYFWNFSDSIAIITDFSKEKN